MSGVEKADENHELPASVIEGRLIAVLQATARPLHWREICAQASADGGEQINLGHARIKLIRMAARSVLKRVAPGIYALPEFADKSYELPRMTIERRFYAVLQEAGESLSVPEIQKQAEADGYGELSQRSVRSTLSQMKYKEVVKKTGRGRYCLAEFAEASYKPPQRTARERLTTAFWQAAGPLRGRDAWRRAEADGCGAIPQSTYSNALSIMARRGLLVRLDWGVYSLPEFSYPSRRQPNSFMTKSELTNMVVDILVEAAGVASTSHIYSLLTAGNLKGLSLENVSNMLKRMASEKGFLKHIARTGDSIYCLAELVETEYAEPKTRIEDRLLAVFRVAGRPLHCQEIKSRAAADGLGEINSSSATATLARMARVGVLVRIGTGIYALPEFADKHYEPLKLSVEMQISLVLREAGRPLHRQTIYCRVEAGSHETISLKGVSSMLSVMTGEGQIVRVSEAVYSLPEFAGEDYEVPRVRIDRRITVILRLAQKPLHIQEIWQRVLEDGFGEIPLGSVRYALSAMLKKKIAERVEQGFYVLPEFAGQPYEPFRLTIEMRIAAAFREAARPLDVREAHQRAEADGYGDINFRSVDSAISSLQRKGLIIRVRRGLYCLADSVNQ